MRNISSSFIFVMSLVFVQLAQAQEVPPSATITSVEYRGTGCDAQSASAVMTPDLGYISILYDRFSVEIGQGTADPNANNQVKNCVIIIRMEVPAGWSFQFDSVEYRGFVNLPNEKTVAMQKISAFSFDGRRGREFQQNIIRGPMVDNFVNTYRAPVAGSISPLGLLRPGNGRGRKFKSSRGGDLNECADSAKQAVLKIKSNIIVRNLGDSTRPTIKMTIDSTDSSVQKLRINWNKCVEEN